MASRWRNSAGERVRVSGSRVRCDGCPCGIKLVYQKYCYSLQATGSSLLWTVSGLTGDNAINAAPGFNDTYTNQGILASEGDDSAYRIDLDDGSKTLLFTAATGDSLNNTVHPQAGNYVGVSYNDTDGSESGDSTSSAGVSFIEDDETWTYPYDSGAAGLGPISYSGPAIYVGDDAWQTYGGSGGTVAKQFKIYGPGETEIADLTSDMGSATDWIISLLYDGIVGRIAVCTADDNSKIQFFSVSSDGTTITQLGSDYTHTYACYAWTIRSGIIYWIEGGDKVWKFDLTTETRTLLLERTSGVWPIVARYHGDGIVIA